MQNTKLVILDVDRTIFQETSWYHACSTPYLLLDKKNSFKFRELNETLYNTNNPLNREEFRRITLSMIDRIITDKFLKLVHRNDLFKQGMFTDGNRFYEAGRYTTENLIHENPYWDKVIELFYRKFDNEIKVVFLSSGYFPFIQGVIDALLERFDRRINYKVVASHLSFENGIVSESGDYLTQEKKKEYVKSIIKNNGKIVFFADDSNEVPELFSIIRNNGGEAYQIEYNSARGFSNWRNIYFTLTNYENIINYLKNESGIQIKNSLFKTSFECKIEKLRIQRNEIGILYMHGKDYRLLSGKWKNEIVNCFERLIFQNNEDVLFRGYSYYYWMPTCICLHFFDMHKLWINMALESIKLLEICLKNRSEENIEIPVFVAIDHLIEAIYRIRYGIEYYQITYKGLYKTGKKDFIAMQRLSKLLTRIMITVINLKIDWKLIADCLAVLDSVSWECWEKYLVNSKMIRELDDSIEIYHAVANIINEIKHNKKQYSMVITFAFGAMALGDMFSEELLKETGENCCNIISHYSSKNRLRRTDGACFMESIPKFYELQKKTMLNKKEKVLLLDNNATSFATLLEAKKELHNLGIWTDAAVVEVNYKNIGSWIVKKPYYEEVEPNWSRVLNYPPIKEYVTSYNTWGSGEKNEILKRVYSKDINEDVIIQRINCLKAPKENRKICRVHNLYDLYVAIVAGATMIGIHIVYSKKKEYYITENEAILKNNRICTLPISNYELVSIQNMLEKMPQWLMPVLVIEEPLDINIVKETVKLLKLQHYGIQMQFRASEDYLKSVMSLKPDTVLLVVGLSQNDIEEYIESRRELLRLEKDFVLLDMSKHQPDFLKNNQEACIYSDEYKKEELLLRKAQDLKTVNNMVMIADDVEPYQIKKYVHILQGNGIVVKGIDMQNIIEYSKDKQKYILIKKKNEIYEAKIRKSIDMAELWHNNPLLK